MRTKKKTFRRTRNYRREYDRYFGPRGAPHLWTAVHKRRRKEKTKRNQARSWFIRRYGKRRLYGKDIDHRNGNALDNRRRNLRVSSITANRSRNGRKVTPY